MQATDTRFRPLLALAAGSIIVISAVAVAALPGAIPPSKGETTTPPALRQSVAKPMGQLAVVESVREVNEPGEAKGVGAVAGGVVGGVLGLKLGKKKPLVTVAGAAGGAFAGHQIEKHARGEKHWEVAVRLDDGSQRTLSSEVEPAWRAGDRVRVVDNRLQPA